MADPAVATPPAAPVAGAVGGPAGTPPAAPPPDDAKQPSLLNPEPPKAPPAEADKLKKDEPKAPPAEIKLTLPKDSLLTQAQVDKIAAISRERGLSQEAATAVMEAQAAHLKEFADGHLKAWGDQVATWEKELQSHKEFGGEKLKEFDRGATEVILQYGGQEMLKLMKESGYSKNPVVAQFLWNVHKARRPDKIVAPHAAAVAPNSKSVAESLFPSAVKK